MVSKRYTRKDAIKDSLARNNLEMDDEALKHLEDDNLEEAFKYGTRKLSKSEEENIEEEVSLETAKDLVLYSYNKILEQINYYMDIPEAHSKIIALWIIGSYLHKEFNSFPFLFINAMRGSGKSRLLNFIAHLAMNGNMTNSMTESVLFRTAKDHTIIIDENESIIKKEKSALRELLNSAYKKGSSVKRMKKTKTKEGSEEMVVEEFDLYCPVVMANISGMEEVLSDRCVTLILEKSSDLSKTQLIEDFDENPILEEIKRTLECMKCRLCRYVGKKNLKKEWNNYIKQSYIYTYLYTLPTLPTLPTSFYTANRSNFSGTNKSIPTLPTLKINSLDESNTKLFEKITKLKASGRNLELYFPLIILAEMIHPTVLDDILNIAKENLKEKSSSEYIDSPDVALYEFISNKEPLKYHNISDLLQEFKTFYSSGSNDDDFNTMWLSRGLRRLKLVLDSRRLSRGSTVMLNVAKAKEKLLIFHKGEKGE